MHHRGSSRATPCTGPTRRSLLQVGALSALGLSLPRWLAAREATPAPARKDLNCILLWMGGGPSNIDTFDMKPDAPAEYRGEFRPIASRLPGVPVCEHLPRMAQRMDRLCLIRSTAHPESGDHVAATHYLLTGYPQRPDPTGQPINSVIYPAFGSIVAREKGWKNALPPYALVPTPKGGIGYHGAGYFGRSFDPLVVSGDPNSPQFRIENVSIPDSVGAPRTARRRSMLAALDNWQRHEDGLLGERNRFYRQAYDFITSPAAKKAFRLDLEPDSVRERYGRTVYGQSCLLARRLIESGVRFVTLNTTVWDTHEDNFRKLKTHPQMLPALDIYWSALLDDLEQRGLLDSTLVIWMGEFGRTPKVNGAAGRDHWAHTNAICLAGGGVKAGAVVGQTDRRCERVVGTPHSTHDLAATFFHLLGIDGTKEALTPDGRPVLLNYHGKPITEALA
ncbi:MAG: DUF1501 domain-containing protein [Gemmataceae bacterium]